MASNPHNQAELATFAKRKKEQMEMNVLHKAESNTLEFLSWAELPMTKEMRRIFADMRKKFQNHFESLKWKGEGEAFGLAYSMRFLDVLENAINSVRREYANIQTKKQQKEG